MMDTKHAYIKRLFDFSLSVFLLIFLFPIAISVTFLVYYKLGSPVLFKQRRPGINGIPFLMLKFRTMTEMKDSNGNDLADSERLTQLGRLMRKYSIDELPSLINIAKGDMSFIGPRPLLLQYMPYYTVEEMKRFNVKPGLTGLAQISGRNSIGWDRRLQYDTYYVDNYSFMLDMSIFFKSIMYVIQARDVHVDTDIVETFLDQERCNNPRC